MHARKQYGESKIEECPFCGSQALTTNAQDIPVCFKHKESVMQEMKCLCGEYVEPLRGKYGLYFRCMNCGNVNKSRVVPAAAPKSAPAVETKEEPKKKSYYDEITEKKEVTITSRDVEWFS